MGAKAGVAMRTESGGDEGGKPKRGSLTKAGGESGSP